MRTALVELLEWEIRRSWEDTRTGEPQGKPTEKISRESWCSIRDMLADLWDWWGEGVHLRPQPEMDDYHNPQFNKPAYVHELIKYHMPRDISSDKAIVPPRSTTMDAFLGEGLFLLCAAVHGFIITVELEAANMGDSSIFKADEADKVVRVKRYQDKVIKNGYSFFCFRPGGDNRDYFTWYCHRINASGWRPVPDFPSGHVCPFINLQNMNLSDCYFFAANLRGSHFGKADLIGVDFSGANLSRADFSGAHVSRAYLCDTDLCGADLSRADFIEADFSAAYLCNADLSGANLRMANLRQTDLSGADLSGADLFGANLAGANLIRANLRGAYLSETNLRGATTEGADFKGILINQVGVDTLVKEKRITEEQRQQINIIKSAEKK